MRLQMSHVWRRYRVGDSPIVALEDANVRIETGELVAVVGPSGSGKSTFLQLIGLLDTPSEGQVLFDDRNVGSLRDADRTHVRLTSLGFVFQRFHLLNHLTAVENVMLPLEAAGVDLDSRYARATDLLSSVGLADRLRFRPAQLSGGQRQRVAVARAVANRPSVILADEPTGELHTDDKTRVLDLFRSLNADGRTVVIVTHDPDVAAIARRKIEIRDGQLTDEAHRDHHRRGRARGGRVGRGAAGSSAIDRARRHANADHHGAPDRPWGGPAG